MHRLYNIFVNVMYLFAVPTSRDQLPVELDVVKTYSKRHWHHKSLLPKENKKEDLHSNESAFGQFVIAAPSPALLWEFLICGTWYQHVVFSRKPPSFDTAGYWILLGSTGTKNTPDRSRVSVKRDCLNEKDDNLKNPAHEKRQLWKCIGSAHSPQEKILHLWDIL